MTQLEYKRSRQRHIAKVTIDLIAEGGINNASYREIALRAGVSKGSVEHYFSNKNNIIYTALKWINQRAVEREHRAVAKKQGLTAIETRLRCMLPTRPEVIREWKVRIHYWSATFAHRDEQLGMSLRIGGARERLIADLEHAICQDEVPADTDPTVTANMLLHLLAGISCNALVDPNYYDKQYQEKIIKRVITQLSSGCL